MTHTFVKTSASRFPGGLNGLQAATRKTIRGYDSYYVLVFTSVSPAMVDPTPSSFPFLIGTTIK